MMLFLPKEDYGQVTSFQKSVHTPIKTGIVHSFVTEPLPEKNNKNLHLTPAKIFITPIYEPEKKSKPVTGTPESVTPLNVRIFPIQEPQIKQEVKKIRPVVKKVLVSKETSSKPQRSRRPKDQKQWQDWSLEELKKCNGMIRISLDTLNDLMLNQALNKGQTPCTVKQAVSSYLRMCHPWPTVYYTPFNNAVPKSILVQSAVNVLMQKFDHKKCPTLDLTRVDFQKIDFFKGDLSEADFSYSYFDVAFFEDVNLSETIFFKADLDNVLFQNTNLTKAYLKDASIVNGRILKSDASMVNFENSVMTNAQIIDSDLIATNLNNTRLANSYWKGVMGARLTANDATFVESRFDNVFFEEITAQNADFSKTKINDVVFQKAFLPQTQFYKADFNNVSFAFSDLQGACFDDIKAQNMFLFSDAQVQNISFKGADLRSLNGLDLETLRLTKIDDQTIIPNEYPEFEAASYDIDIFTKTRSKTQNDLWSCKPQMCEDRLKGRASNQNITVRAMSILDSPKEDLDTKIWALCTMACVARLDKKLENSQIDILSAYVKRESPWSNDDLFKPYTPIKPDVQMALYILTDPNLKKDRGYDIDLTQIDLRKADLSDGDLTNITLAGSNLSGANLKNTKTDKTFSHFDQTIIDQYTILPKQIGQFMPYQVSDTYWVKPKKVTIHRENISLWTITTDTIDFSDDFISRPLFMDERKEK